jgi:hypothetical protein
MEKKKKCQIDELTFAFLDSKLPPEDQKSERRKQLFIAPSFPPQPTPQLGTISFSCRSHFNPLDSGFIFLTQDHYDLDS